MFQRTRQGAIDLISGEIPISSDTAPLLQKVLDECLGEGQPRAVLDLQNVPLLDSVGLERLLDARERFEQRAGALKLAAPNVLCRDILNVTGVTHQFEVFPEVKAAVASFLQ